MRDPELVSVGVPFRALSSTVYGQTEPGGQGQAERWSLLGLLPRSGRCGAMTGVCVMFASIVAASCVTLLTASGCRLRYSSFADKKMEVLRCYVNHSVSRSTYVARVCLESRVLKSWHNWHVLCYWLGGGVVLYIAKCLVASLASDQ